jgi:hypothetical protein
MNSIEFGLEYGGDSSTMQLGLATSKFMGTHDIVEGSCGKRVDGSPIKSLDDRFDQAGLGLQTCAGQISLAGSPLLISRVLAARSVSTPVRVVGVSHLDDGSILVGLTMEDVAAVPPLQSAYLVGQGFPAAPALAIDASPVIIVVAPGGTLTDLTQQAWRSDPASYYSYSELRALIKESGLSGRGVGLEAHHLLEKQFAARLGLNQADIISVPLTPKWHRNVGGFGNNLDAVINAEIRTLGSTPSSASAEVIWQAHRNVYLRHGYREWAEAIYEAYFKSRGIAF